MECRLLLMYVDLFLHTANERGLGLFFLLAMFALFYDMLTDEQIPN